MKYKKCLFFTILSLFSILINEANAADITTGVSATSLAQALGIDPSLIESARLTYLSDSGTPDPISYGVVSGSIGNYFPTQGSDFVVLSSGNVQDIVPPNNTGSKTTNLSGDGASDGGGDENVRLTLVLKIPPDAKSFNFDFVMYSEEFPEFIGSAFNDFFIAEVGEFAVTFNNSVITDTTNISFDENGVPVSINSSFFDSDVTQITNTQFDGASFLLTTYSPFNGTQTNIPVGDTFVVSFAVGDVGDEVLDSAVFLDNFNFSTKVYGYPVTRKRTQENILEIKNYPNPFNPLTDRNMYFVAQEGIKLIKISIFDFSGKMVRILNSPTGNPVESIIWDGTNIDGKTVAAGMYYYRAQGPEKGQYGLGRLTLIK